MKVLKNLVSFKYYLHFNYTILFLGTIGLGVDLSESFTVIGSYETQLSNSSTIDGIEIKANSIGATLQYKF